MTTWNNTDITRKTIDYPGKFMTVHYEIAGISGDTGGTLTCSQFKKIYNVSVTANQAAAMVAALQWRIAANTVVLTYTNPAAAHTVYISVKGVKG